MFDPKYEEEWDIKKNETEKYYKKVIDRIERERAETENSRRKVNLADVDLVKKWRNLKLNWDIRQTMPIPSLDLLSEMNKISDTGYNPKLLDGLKASPELFEELISSSDQFKQIKQFSDPILGEGFKKFVLRILSDSIIRPSLIDVLETGRNFGYRGSGYKVWKLFDITPDKRVMIYTKREVEFSKPNDIVKHRGQPLVSSLSDLLSHLPEQKVGLIQEAYKEYVNAKNLTPKLKPVANFNIAEMLTSAYKWIL